MRLFLGFVLVALLVKVGQGQPEGRSTVDGVQVPRGFRLEVYARVPGARHLAVAPNGTVFVGTRGQHVYAVTPKREVIEVAEGLNGPNGVAFANGDLYIAEIHRLSRIPQVLSRLRSKSPPQVLNDQLPTHVQHGYRVLRFGPDRRLYIGLGAPCNVCESHDPLGTISRFSSNFKNLEVYARGVRNSMGFDWDPKGSGLWFTDNGRDLLGDALPLEEINQAPKAGLHFGFPYRHGYNQSDPDFGRKAPPNLIFAPPAGVMQAHVAPLGLRFYRGKQFPAHYRQGFFVANHGSWNSTTPVGYRVMFCATPKSGEVRPGVFAQGWLRKGKDITGRPVDLEELPDGSLVISDDFAGVLYRLSYSAR